MKIGQVDIELWSKPGITGSGPPAVNTERMIEVPLGLWFIKNYGGSAVTEVGAVTPYFQYFSETIHTVVDMYDIWPTCIRKKIEEMDFTGLSLLSISTIEHVHNGEYNQPKNPAIAIEVLKKMMASKNWLITWAAGYHRALDNFVEDTKIQSLKLFRSQFSEWAPVSSLKNVNYDSPFPYGNAIYVVTNCKELY
jgi:hypothetical protein